MFLFELPPYLYSKNINELIIKSSNNQLNVNLIGARYSKNTILTKSQSILFTTPDIEKSLVNSISFLETEYLITKLNDIIKQINPSENISIFHYDQIFNNNLFKFYNSNIKISHIVYSNDRIDPQPNNQSLFVSANIQELDQKGFNKILKNELNDSLVFIKIKRDHSVNLHKMISILSQYAYIMNLDHHNGIITIKLKFPIDFINTFKNLATDNLSIIKTVDRTEELYKYLK
jgi:hypothetical protein